MVYEDLIYLKIIELVYCCCLFGFEIMSDGSYKDLKYELELKNAEIDELNIELENKKEEINKLSYMQLN